MPHRNSHLVPSLLRARYDVRTFVRTHGRIRSLLLFLSFSLPTLLSPTAFLALLSLALPHSCHAVRISNNRVGRREEAPSGILCPPQHFSSRILPLSAVFSPRYLLLPSSFLDVSFTCGAAVRLIARVVAAAFRHEQQQQQCRPRRRQRLWQVYKCPAISPRHGRSLRLLNAAALTSVFPLSPDKHVSLLFWLFTSFVCKNLSASKILRATIYYVPLYRCMLHRQWRHKR